MPGLVLAAPTVAPPIEVRQWGRLGVTWTGPDGSVWDLTDPLGGVLLRREGTEGLHNPVITKYSSTSGAIPGKRLRGWQAQSRDVFWPIHLWADGSDAWLERQRAFFNTIHPDREGVWKVTAGTESRTLRLTGVFEEGHAYELDPYQQGWAQYGVTLEAVQPYWQGTPEVYGPWSAGEAQPFIDPETLGPPFHIGSARAFGKAVASNPGDVDVCPVWRATDELDDIVLGVGSTVIEVPFPLSNGDVLVIDTDPRRPTATLNGEDATEALGLQDYAQIPPGAKVPLTVAATGSGSITCQVMPLYFRAF